MLGRTPLVPGLWHSRFLGGVANSHYTPWGAGCPHRLPGPFLLDFTDVLPEAHFYHPPHPPPFVLCHPPALVDFSNLGGLRAPPSALSSPTASSAVGGRDGKRICVQEWERAHEVEKEGGHRRCVGSREWTPQSPFSSVQSLSRVWLFKTPGTAACEASLSIANSRCLPRLMPIESLMSSNNLILCPPLLLPSIIPSIRVFSNESVLHIRWPKY